MPYKVNFSSIVNTIKNTDFLKEFALLITAVHRRKMSVFKLPHFYENGNKTASVFLPVYMSFLTISECLQLVINIQAPCKCPTNSLC